MTKEEMTLRANQEALQAPNIFLDPINYITPVGGLIKSGLQKASGKLASGLPKIENMPNISESINNAISTAKGMIPGEISDIDGVVGKMLGGGSNIVSNGITAMSKKPITSFIRSGIGQPMTIGSAENTKGVINPTAQPNVASPQITPKTSEVQPHPLSKFKDVYDYAASLKPKEFQRFVNLNQDTVKGLGYIEEMANGKPTGKIQKVISRPEQEALTPNQIKSVGGILPGIVGIENAKTARSEANELKKIGIENAKQARLDKQFDQKSTVYNLEGKPVVDNTIGVINTILEGTIPPDNYSPTHKRILETINGLKKIPENKGKTDIELLRAYKKKYLEKNNYSVGG